MASGTLTYLNGEVKNTSPSSVSRGVIVDNCVPFMKGTFNKTATAASYKIPTSTPTTGNYWQINTYHQGNKTGVATVVDNTLDQPGMPVTSIAIGSTATISYTLSNGVTGQVTGTTYTAPAGQRIVAATVVSGPLAGPNLAPSGTASTHFWVRYFFSLMPGATPGDRTNTASATISYPDYPTVPPFTPVGSPASQTVNLFDVEPFAKASFSKTSNSDTYPVTTTTTSGHQWVVDTCNSSNVEGVATITDTFNQAGIPVYSIRTNLSATVNYTLDNGTTGTYTGTLYTAPAGRSIVDATVVSPSLAGPNATPAGTACTLFRVTYYFRVLAGATPGDRTNTASATMTFPNTTLGTVTPTGSPATKTITLFTNTPYTIDVDRCGAHQHHQPGLRAPGRRRGAVEGQRGVLQPGDRPDDDAAVRLPRSQGMEHPAQRSLLGGRPGATFSYQTITYAGVAHSAVVVQWPSPVAGTGNAPGSDCVALSQLSVKTTPTLSAIVGTQTAYAFVGDAS